MTLYLSLIVSIYRNKSKIECNTSRNVSVSILRDEKGLIHLTDSTNFWNLMTKSWAFLQRKTFKPHISKPQQIK